MLKKTVQLKNLVASRCEAQHKEEFLSLKQTNWDGIKLHKSDKDYLLQELCRSYRIKSSCFIVEKSKQMGEWRDSTHLQLTCNTVQILMLTFEIN